jgi:hypothetical protein
MHYGKAVFCCFFCFVRLHWPIARLSAWLLLVVLLSFGCKHRSSPEADLRGMDKEKAIANHHASHLRFDILTLKGKADFEDFGRGQKMGFTYRIDIAQDSLILVSASKFGVPAMHMLMGHDSVRIRVPLNQTAAICDYRLFKKMVGMDFDLIKLQNFLIGEVQFEEPLTMTSKKGNEIVLEGNHKGQSMSWILNGRHFRLEKMRVSDPNLGKESVITYSDFEKLDGQLLASTVLLEVTQPQKVRIELHHTGIARDKEKVDFRFRIPASHKITSCDRMVPQQP